jgi:hypothetical protein
VAHESFDAVFLHRDFVENERTDALPGNDRIYEVFMDRSSVKENPWICSRTRPFWWVFGVNNHGLETTQCPMLATH